MSKPRPDTTTGSLVNVKMYAISKPEFDKIQLELSSNAGYRMTQAEVMSWLIASFDVKAKKK